MRLVNIKIVIVQNNFTSYTYNGVNMENEELLFSNCFIGSSKGHVEFCGAVHGLMLLRKRAWYGSVYVENEYIKKCIEKKKYNHKSNLENSEKINSFIDRCNLWIYEQKDHNIKLVSELKIKTSEEIAEDLINKYFKNK